MLFARSQHRPGSCVATPAPIRGLLSNTRHASERWAGACWFSAILVLLSMGLGQHRRRAGMAIRLAIEAVWLAGLGCFSGSCCPSVCNERASVISVVVSARRWPRKVYYKVGWEVIWPDVCALYMRGHSRRQPDVVVTVVDVTLCGRAGTVLIC
jgi:hypothetical protein